MISSFFAISKLYHMLQYQKNKDFMDWSTEGYAFSTRWCSSPINNMVANYLNERLGNDGPIRWLARSPDLSSLDFFCGLTWKTLFIKVGVEIWENWVKIDLKSLNEWSVKLISHAQLTPCIIFSWALMSTHESSWTLSPRKKGW